jgi:hypothetical protein
VVRPSRALGGWVALPIAALVFFAFLLVPNWKPAAGASVGFVLYTVCVVVFVVALALAAVGGAVRAILAIRRGRSAERATRLCVAALLGLAAFGLVAAAGRFVRGRLPTGSYLRSFDRAVWSDVHSADFVAGDATPRQKMLGDVVKRLPGRRRAEIEADLGASLETPYFRSTGRDMIYVLGPERDALFGIDSEWLLIWLDANGRFERYEIRTD